MPFVPHTEEDISRMLGVIGADSIETLFDEIPKELLCGRLDRVPAAMSEMQITRLMHQRAKQDGSPLNFIGAGAYEHHIPAAVWQITTRGEFYTAYTPYQAEASQGSLQLLYEFQTMMCGLTGMDVSNASLYDGASAVAEAVLMAIRAQRKIKNRRVLVPGAMNPLYRDTVKAIVTTQDIELVDLPFSKESGKTITETLSEHADDPPAALVITQPNFFGNFEEVDAMTDWARAHNVFVIAVVNPVALALLKAPGEWGSESEGGADVVCGEGQPLGAPLSSGGPYFGFMACRQAHVRQMPGRIAGRTVDLDGKPGFTLTLQAREQHIRRSKATSNICTNQGLLVTAATIHMSLLGPEGLRRVAAHSMKNTADLAAAVSAVDGVSVEFDAGRFHEFVIRLPKPAAEVSAMMAEQGVLAGLPLCKQFPDMDHCLLVCVTETKIAEDIETYVSALREALS